MFSSSSAIEASYEYNVYIKLDFKQTAINQSIDRSEIRMLHSKLYEEITQYKQLQIQHFIPKQIPAVYW